MNKTKVLHKEIIGSFFYTREESWSEQLGRIVPYGILSTCEDIDDAQESFYFFHGGNGDDQQFIQAKLPQAINSENLKRLQTRKVKIVLPYIGTSMLHGRFSDYFFDELMTHMDKSKSLVKHLGGLSMGGQAALSAFFRKPDLFKSVGTHFATLIDFNFLSEPIVQNFAKNSGIDRHHLEILISEFRREFPTLEDFKGFDPLQLVRNVKSQEFTSKKIFFDVGKNDDFGLQAGNQKLHLLLESKSISHFYAEVEGRHDGAFLQVRINSLLQTLFT